MDNILNNNILVFKIIINMFEISIEKLLYLCFKENKNLFNFENLIKVVKNEIYNFSTSNDIYSEILKINNNMLISNSDKELNEEEIEYILNNKLSIKNNYKIDFINNKKIIEDILIKCNSIDDIIIEENNQTEKISVEIPIYIILKQTIESKYLDDYGNHKIIIKDIEMIDKIWDEWITHNKLIKDLKNIINQIR